MGASILGFPEPCRVCTTGRWCRWGRRRGEGAPAGAERSAPTPGQDRTAGLRGPFRLSELPSIFWAKMPICRRCSESQCKPRAVCLLLSLPRQGPMDAAPATTAGSPCKHPMGEPGLRSTRGALRLGASQEAAALDGPVVLRHRTSSRHGGGTQASVAGCGGPRGGSRARSPRMSPVPHLHPSPRTAPGRLSSTANHTQGRTIAPRGLSQSLAGSSRLCQVCLVLAAWLPWQRWELGGREAALLPALPL